MLKIKGRDTSNLHGHIHGPKAVSSVRRLHPLQPVAADHGHHVALLNAEVCEPRPRGFHSIAYIGVGHEGVLTVLSG